MSKGVVYVMTTSVAGLIKIGKSEPKQFKERMRHLERNGYYNVAGLKKYFAMELSDYSEKERLIQEIFNKHRVEDSELFALDKELVKQLLLAFDGRVIFPENLNKEEAFDETVKVREAEGKNKILRSELGIKNGDTLVFKDDSQITCKNINDSEVEYEGEIHSLSGLTHKIMKSRGLLNPSGKYQGNRYWEFGGRSITQIRDEMKRRKI